VQLKPHTGRRHQLRKHLSEIGNSILGDRDYGKNGLILSGKGLYLHASSIQFLHPITQEELFIEAALPKKFRKLFP
jgi:23S rRNA pseudouridine1911/1915/1917 synthase